MTEHESWAEAFVAAHAAIPDWVDDSKTAYSTAKGGRVSFGYAALPYTTRTINAAFAEHGMAIVDMEMLSNDNTFLEIIRHVIHGKTGEVQRFQYQHPIDLQRMGNDRLKSWGATLTYCRRQTDYMFAHRHSGKDDPDEEDLSPTSQSRDPKETRAQRQPIHPQQSGLTPKCFQRCC